MAVKIKLDDPETRATWEAAQQAKKEVESWPAWKRGESAAASGETVGPTDQTPATGVRRSKKLYLCHLELAGANAFVTSLHRHHRKVQGHRFSLGAFCEGSLVGVAIVGRPVGGQHQADWIEVTRLCTDGTENACSFLYSACARAGAALGYLRVQTYILGSEPGVSLKAAGWKFERMSHPVGWHHDGPRAARKVEKHLMERKQLWYRDLDVHGVRTGNGR